MRMGLPIVLAGLCAARAAHADSIREAAPPPEPPGKNLVYVELGGKAGAYGVGYERAIAPWLGLGFAGSFLVVRDQQISTGAAYLHATVARHRKHAAFVELGAILAHSKIPSPVDSWDGMSDTGGGGVLGVGWERAGRHVVVRAQGQVLAGEGGLAPWAGVAIGVRP